MKKHTPSRLRRNGITRRDFLKVTAAGGAALLLPAGLTSQLAHGASSPSLTKFKDPLPIPGIMQADADGSFAVAMKEFRHRFHSDLPEATVWGYGNEASGYSTPGPTFVVNSGTRTQVTWTNNLSTDPAAPHYLPIDPRTLAVIGINHHTGQPETAVHGATNNRKAVVHLHGAQGITAFADGDPEQTLLPTEAATYDYAPQPRAATLWYHDHALGNTRLNVYMGLAGAFIVRDPSELQMIASQQLPDPAYEMPLVLQDRRLTATGKLAYSTRFNDTFMGDVMLVNGKAWPHLDVQPRKYRFRLLNGSNTRNYTLQLGDGSLMFQQIGSDGGFLAQPVPLMSITLTPGERADVIVDFSNSGGQNIVLMNHHIMANMTDEYPIHEVMQFRVGSIPAIDNVTLPAALATIPPLDPTNAPQRYFKLEDEFDPNVGDAKWHIAGPRLSDPPEMFEHPTHDIRNDSIEVWNWVNKSDMIHPMHLHLVQFQVLGRWKAREDSKGNIIPGRNIGVDPNETGWKDTVRVGPFELVRVIARFKGELGSGTENFPFHCHVLEHEDHEMMRLFRLVY